MLGQCSAAEMVELQPVVVRLISDVHLHVCQLVTVRFSCQLSGRQVPIEGARHNHNVRPDRPLRPCDQCLCRLGDPIRNRNPHRQIMGIVKRLNFLQRHRLSAGSGLERQCGVGTLRDAVARTQQPARLHHVRDTREGLRCRSFHGANIRIAHRMIGEGLHNQNVLIAKVHCCHGLVGTHAGAKLRTHDERIHTEHVPNDVRSLLAAGHCLFIGQRAPHNDTTSHRHFTDTPTGNR